MHSRVRSLYKEFMLLGPQMPTMGLDRYRDTVRKRFMRNSSVVPDTKEFKEALAWGRAGLRDVQAVIHVHKFRHMKKSYDWESSSNGLCAGTNLADVDIARGRMESSLSEVRSWPSSSK
jgi:hypothetical protein